MGAVLNCPKCKGLMQEGCAVSRTNVGWATLIEWIEGPPRVSFWKGLETEKASPIKTYRCTDCGYLESYARREPPMNHS